MNNLHVKSAKDLITKPEARRSGFVEYALRKNKEAVPYIDKAKALMAVISAKCKTPQDILQISNIRESLLEAAGISEKAKAHLHEEDKLQLLHEFVDKVLVPRGNDFVEEIAFRYLLTAGDALGGKMRNIIGSIASEKLTRFIVAQLSIKSMVFEFSKEKYDKFSVSSKYNIDDAQYIKSIRWRLKSGEMRHLVYNTTVPQVKKNIDIVLLSKVAPGSTSAVKEFLKNQAHYACIGELKGGIDPAGADEHWKTASTALGRVRTAFTKVKVPLVFIGAAIEAAMAEEIFQQYSNSNLSNCANLTSEEQLSAFCDWFTSI